MTSEGLLGAIQRFNAWHDKWEPYLGLTVNYLAFFIGIWIILSPVSWIPQAALYEAAIQYPIETAWVVGLIFVLLSYDGRRFNKQRVFGK